MSLNALMGALRVNLGLDTASFSRGLTNAQKNMNGFQRQMMTFAGRISGVFAAAFSAKAAMDAADAWSDMSSRVGIAIGNMERAPEIMARINDIASMTYSDLQQTANGFINNAASLKELGYSTEDALDYTEALNNALVVSGAKGQRAESVARALSNAMATGKLSGDGLNSVLTDGGRIAELLADQLGTTRNGLIKMARDGKITADVIGTALLGSMEALRDEAAAMPATIGDGMVLLKNAFTAAVGQIDQASGASATFANAIVSVANVIQSTAGFIVEHFNAIRGMVIATGIAAVAVYAPSIGAAIAATWAWIAALFTLRGALIATGIGAFIVIAGLLIGKFLDLVDKVGGFGNAMTLLGDVCREAWDRIQNGAAVMGYRIKSTWEGIKSNAYAMTASIVSNGIEFINRYIGIWRGGYEGIKTLWSSLPEMIGDLVYKAAQSTVNGVVYMLNAVKTKISDMFSGLADLPGLELMGGAGLALRALGNFASSEPIAEFTIENPYEGAASAAVSAIQDAFSDGYRTNTIDGTHLTDTLTNASRDAAIAAAGASRDASTMASLMSDSWESIAALRDAMSSANEEASTLTDPEIPTVPPPAPTGSTGGGGGSGGESQAVKAQADAYKELQNRVSDLGKTWWMTAEQKKVYDEQQKIGTAASADAVAALVEQENRLERFKSALDTVRQSFESNFTAMLTGAKSFKEAFAGILRDIANMLAKQAANRMFQSIIGGSIGGGMGGGGTWGAIGSAIGSVFGFANGTRGLSHTGLSLVGEHGPELLSNLPRGTKIRSNPETNKLLAGAASGGGRTAIEVVLSPDLQARVLEEAKSQSVQISQQTVNGFARNQLPNAIAKHNAQPRMR